MVVASGRSRFERRGGIGARLLIFLTVVFATGALGWMLFLPVVLTSQIRRLTGFDATVGSLAVNPFAGTVHLRGLRVTNPPTYPVTEFLEVRELTADLEMFSLFSSRPVFSAMSLDVSRLTLVKRDASQNNAAAFWGYLMRAGSEAEFQHGDRSRRFLIRRLSVRIDEVVIADYTRRPPDRQTYKLSFNQSYRDVTGVRQLLTPGTLESLLPLGSALNGLLSGAFGEVVNEVVRDASKAGGLLLKDAGRNSAEKLRGYFDALEESKKP
jgi:hypothetical protein